MRHGSFQNLTYAKLKLVCAEEGAVVWSGQKPVAWVVLVAQPGSNKSYHTIVFRNAFNKAEEVRLPSSSRFFDERLLPHKRLFFTRRAP